VCARTALADRWLEGDLSGETWGRLRPDLPLAEHVHLQGWGEPLLHPGLRAMVRHVHEAGCSVGITTNGELLPAARPWITAERVDVLAASLAGLGESNRRLRDGTDAGDVLDALAEMASDRGRSGRPKLHVSFLLLRDNAHDLPGLVRAAAHCGVTAVLVSHVDCTPTAELFGLSAIVGGGVPRSVRDAVEEASGVARQLGVELRQPALQRRDMLTCDNDALRMVSVRWDGRVGPCAEQTLSIEEPWPRWTDDGCVEVRPAWYGCLEDAPLSAILDDEAYRRFTDPLRRRCEADRRFRGQSRALVGWGAVALRELERAHQRREEVLADNPFPPACEGCAKSAGW
jgi:MoaA/NifB/PqqE/SkfB family radical SAM enzyme